MEESRKGVLSLSNTHTKYVIFTLFQKPENMDKKGVSFRSNFSINISHLSINICPNKAPDVMINEVLL